MRSTALILAGLAAATAASSAFLFRDAAPAQSERSDTPASVPDVTVPAEEIWRRPPGPLRVALQAGHWKAREAPAEQAGLRDNGTRGGGKAEWEVNLEIARRAAELLGEKGFQVEVLPTTIPPGYWADLFVSVHADGGTSPSASGYRAAAPRRDVTGRAEEFADVLDQAYGEATGLPYYGNVTRRMRGYYAFNNRRYEHALHPMTVGAILETGFLTSPRDRNILIGDPGRAARGIADAVVRFSETMPLLPQVIPTAAPARPTGDAIAPSMGAGQRSSEPAR